MSDEFHRQKDDIDPVNEESHQEAEPIEIDLSERFPDLMPISSAPSMFTFNGCGVSVYGSRDYDDLTGTYVKTYCLCFLFFPILALRAYRVANADSQGWHFLGRTTLSPVARSWNCAVLTAVVCLIGIGVWRSHWNSPDQVAKRDLRKADAKLQDGELVPAIRLYEQVATGGTVHAVPAQQQIKLLLEGPLRDAAIEDAEQVLRVAAGANLPAGSLGDIAASGMAVAERHADSDPKRALAILDLVTPLASDPKPIADKRRELLERTIAENPTDVALVSKFAVLLEQEGDIAECEELLTPLKDQLGGTEGARILGQTYASRGQLNDAHALLVPYCETRLAELHQAEKQFEQAYETEYQTIINQLQQGDAPASFYRRYDAAADEAGQSAIVQEYVNSKLSDSQMLEQSRQSIMKHSPVVPVAIDLGIVLLQRAHTLPDPNARQAELERAEKTFLAIRGMAGESQQYKLFLGQVYFWLGKHDEARTLFDQLLEASSRDVQTLMAVANVYRDVGLPAEGRELMEEAYEQETNSAKKQNIAGLRSVTSTDLDDRIAWLGRADESNPNIKAGLASALGERAVEEGRESAAISHFRKAIATYEAMPESTTTLNNGALPCFALFHLTGDRADFNRGMEKLDKAVALSPSDSILLGNAAHEILQQAMFDIISDAVDLKALRTSAGVSLLGFVYNSEAERQPYVDRLKADEGVAKAISYFDKVTLLAPKNPTPYSTIASLHRFTRDGGSLRQGLDKLKQAEVDLTDSVKRTLDFYTGANDDKLKADLRQSRKRAVEVVQRSRPVGGATLAIAATVLTTQEVTAWMLDENVDVEAAVALAEEAFAEAPSGGSRYGLLDAIGLRAVTTLAKQDQQFADIVTRTRRSLRPQLMLAVTLSRGGPLVAKLMANDDVKRIATLIQEEHQLFPNGGDPWEWALLKPFDMEAAAEIAETVKTYELSRLSRQLDRLLNPLGTSTALNSYWELMILGQQDEANQVLQSSADRGMPLPFEID